MTPDAVSSAADVAAQRPVATRPTAAGAGFADALRRAAGDLRFSGHAMTRLGTRGIDVGERVLDRLGTGVDRAAAKGSRDAVVLVDDTAFVVSVRNRTVITAVGREHMREQVFTNIDSAVIA
ncbi:MAG TPA: TIGR02530 family flagellar biosynthesis protein [Solirubrobacteraceae bacterium]|nr:TIGR02530 family flagellar biosynthesis protein [Solirubrobacteraceae bacterium]